MSACNTLLENRDMLLDDCRLTANMTEMERLVHEMVLSWNCLTYEKNKVEISQLGVSVNAEKIQNILK